MKRIIPLLLALVLLAGCSGQRAELDRAMALRAKMLSQNISFDTVITADYGDKTYTFRATCQADAKGNLSFTVQEPQSISGIAGKISESGGKLTFDGKALSFPLLADDQLSPVAAPWVLIRTLRSGYLTSCALEGGRLRLAVDDSYQSDALHLDIWLDGEDIPCRCEILWQGRRIVSLSVENFTFV